MDRGWAYNAAAGRHDLLDRDGRMVAWVTDEFLSAAPAGTAARLAARRGWPELVPGWSWWCCLLSGGPADGLREYLHPVRYGEPPGELAYCQELRGLVLAGPAPESGTTVTYRRQIQVCGHGAACPHPYTLDRGLW